MDSSYRPSCFVIAPVEARLGRFLEELREHRVEPFFISDFLRSGKKILPQLRSAFRSVDFVIAIIFRSPSLENTLFELGFALGLTRPVLLFAEPGVELPSAVVSMQVHFIEPGDFEALIPAVEEFIERKSYQAQLKRYAMDTLDHYEARAPRLEREKSKDALNALRRMQVEGHPLLAGEVESALLDTFKSLGWYTIEAPSRDTKGRAPDLAIWIDDVQRQLGNPIAIEIKSNVPPGTFLDVVSSFSSNLQQVGAKAGILISLHELYELSGYVPDTYPPIFILSLDELTRRLEDDTFLTLLKRQHKVSAF